MWSSLALAALLIATPASARKPKKGAEAPRAERAERAAPAPAPEGAEAPVAPDVGSETIVPQETVALPCGYEPGAAHVYAIEKRSERRLPRQEPSVQGNRNTITLTVVSHEGNTTQLDVRSGGHELLHAPQDPATEALLRSIAEVSASVPVRVAVDHDTSTPRVVDSTALMAAYAGLAEQARALVLEQQPDAPPEVLAAVDEALGNRELAELSIVQDLQPLFGFTCGDVPVGRVEYQTGLPNPFGSAPLPAVGTLEGVVTDATVAFSVHERLDPVRVMTYLRPILTQMGLEVPEEAGLEDMRVELGTDLEVVVDRSTGWPVRWSSKRTGTVLDGGRTDTVVVTRVE